MNKDYKQHINSCFKLIKKSSKIIRIASYNFCFSEENEALFLEVLKRPHKIIIGVSSLEDPLKKTQKSALLFLSQNNFNFKIVPHNHMKLFSVDSKALVGGINLTNSSYKDFSLKIKGKEVKKINKFFDQVWNS